MPDHVGVPSYFVSPAFLTMCCDANSCDKLGGEHDVKVAKRILDFRSRFWVCTGSTSRGFVYLSATLDECVAAEFYRGSAYDDESASYKGLRFVCSHFMNTRWGDALEFVFTGRQINLKTIRSDEKNLYRAMRSI